MTKRADANDGVGVIQRALDHYSKEARTEVEIPEWEVTVYVTPLTLKERQKINAATKGDDLATILEAVILKTVDEDGKAVFSRENKRDLMTNVSSLVLDRLFLAIAQDNVESAEKN